MRSRRRTFHCGWICILAFGFILCGCDTPPAQDQPPDAPQNLEIVEPDSSDGWIVEVGASTGTIYYPGCKPDGVIIEAFLQPDAAGIELVHVRYSIRNTDNNSATAWTETPLQPQGVFNGLEHYGIELPDVGADALAFLQGAPGVFEYQVRVQYTAGMSEVWPDDGAGSAQIPIEICSSASWTIVEYGPDVDQVGYGPGCSSTEATFAIIVENAFLVDSGWLQYQFFAPSNQPQAVSPLLTAPLSKTAPAPGYPDAVMYSVTLDVDAEAPAYMNGQSGQLTWNMYLEKITGEVFEFPQGGPPTINIQTCVGAFSDKRLSTELFYYRQSECTKTPNEVTLRVKADHPAGIDFVEVYFRAKVKTSDETTAWESVLMTLSSDGFYTRTIDAGLIPPGAAPQEAWFQYQFIATDMNGDLHRSEVYGDITLQGCVVILDMPG